MSIHGTKNGLQIVVNTKWSVWEFHVCKMWRLEWLNYRGDEYNHIYALYIGPLIFARRILPKESR